MKAYEQTDYQPALEVGTLLLTASTAKDFVSYERKGGRRLKYLPYLLPNHSLYPSEALLGEEYPLLSFEKFAKDLSCAVGFDCYSYIMHLWTFAYYTGWAGFSSSDVFVSTDGVNFRLPPLFNYAGAFGCPCDYESIKPPRRAFQCYWHFFSDEVGLLRECGPLVHQAISHFTDIKFYR